MQNLLVVLRVVPGNNCDDPDGPAYIHARKCRPYWFIELEIEDGVLTPLWNILFCDEGEFWLSFK